MKVFFQTKKYADSVYFHALLNVEPGLKSVQKVICISAIICVVSL